MLLLLDNRDSFTFNLVQAFRVLGATVEVVASEAIDVTGIAARRPTHLVIGPGPAGPREAGVSVDAAAAFSGKLPVLGVCLGHQAIAVAFGAAVVRTARPVHGKPALLDHDGARLFAGLPTPLEVGRYHSLAVDPASIRPPLAIAARARDDGTVQAIAHAEHPTFGVQFHPESVLTPDGLALLRNFLRA